MPVVSETYEYCSIASVPRGADCETQLLPDEDGRIARVAVPRSDAARNNALERRESDYQYPITIISTMTAQSPAIPRANIRAANTSPAGSSGES